MFVLAYRWTTLHNTPHAYFNAHTVIDCYTVRKRSPMTADIPHSMNHTTYGLFLVHQHNWNTSMNWGSCIHMNTKTHSRIHQKIGAACQYAKLRPILTWSLAVFLTILVSNENTKEEKRANSPMQMNRNYKEQEEPDIHRLTLKMFVLSFSSKKSIDWILNNFSLPK